MTFPPLVNSTGFRSRAWVAPRRFETVPSEATTIPLPLGLGDRFALGLVTPAEALAELENMPDLAESLDAARAETSTGA